MAILRECRYIVKPLSAGEGIGIKLLDGLGATAPYATMAQSHVIQPYAPRQNQYRSTNSVCVIVAEQFVTSGVRGQVPGKSAAD
eukprot:COSAG03_NODE_2021_length_3208_cov_2.392087_2_plen_84_part_00